jgi:hypothetical protein
VVTRGMTAVSSPSFILSSDDKKWIDLYAWSIDLCMFF